MSEPRDCFYHMRERIAELHAQLATAQRDRDEAIAHAVGMSQEITHLGEQLATEQARIKRLTGALRAVRPNVCSYLCPSVKIGSGWDHDEKCLRIKQALADAPFTGEAKHE